MQNFELTIIPHIASRFSLRGATIQLLGGGGGEFVKLFISLLVRYILFISHTVPSKRFSSLSLNNVHEVESQTRLSIDVGANIRIRVKRGFTNLSVIYLFKKI